MWIVIHIAKGKAARDRIVAALEADGVLVRVKEADQIAQETNHYYQICVLHAEAEQAKALLRRLGV